MRSYCQSFTASKGHEVSCDMAFISVAALPRVVYLIYFACFVQELTVHFVLFGAVYFSLCQQYLCTFGNVQARRSR